MYLWEALWLAERLIGGKGLIIGSGRRGLTIYYACPGWGGRCTLLVAMMEAKREVAANSEEVKLIEDKGYKTKLTPPDDMRINTVRLLCSLA